ncbi:ABC transporter substrate-binding protein [Robbsia andropogonis]|uniref:ABC transporter substrate-binding protein n=2 Tax=Robbsia andropogonis TaxID=28092 RepID=UPI00209FF155|nr:ABC transporter substrate-binding protein [Robbsia andropogonis]MCP1116527.1 ABC transporter substrate-binding protein [Robbsia andropogonis]MCP1126794.1 ABC transporter substrate-binding protein [Robbsia andropogonis]
MPEPGGTPQRHGARIVGTTRSPLHHIKVTVMRSILPRRKGHPTSPLRLRIGRRAAVLVGVCATVLTMLAAPMQAHAAPVRIGYWTSGVSLGFGAVLEAKGYLKAHGVDATFVRFSDVNAPTRALAADAIDLAFGAAAASVFATASEGVPVKIFLATQPADVQFVVPEDSPIKSLSEFRGKKIGMSPAGSSVASIAQAVLAGNYGIRPTDFSLVGGNESRLAQFLVQKQVDGAALRSVTIAQLHELKVRQLGTFSGEWRKYTKTDAVPYIGVGAVRGDLIAQRPDQVAKIIAAMRDTLAWGATHPDDVALILQKTANLPPEDAKVYAAQWRNMNRAAFEPSDIETLKRENALFVSSGILKGTLPDNLFVTGPYEQSKSIKEIAQ